MVKDNLEQLRRLQELAVQVDQHRRDAEMLEVDIRNQERLLADRKRRAGHVHEKRIEASKQADATQLSIQEAEGQIKQLNQQMNAVRHNKEMEAIQRSIASHRADIQRWEDQCLAALSTVDQMEQEGELLAGEVSRTEQELERRKEQVAEQKARYEREITDLEGRLDQVRGSIEPGVLDAYERLTRSNLKSPLAVVKARVCQGCFTRITKQTENLLLRGTEIVYCHSCGRMLMLDEEEP